MYTCMYYMYSHTYAYNFVYMRIFHKYTYTHTCTFLWETLRVSMNIYIHVNTYTQIYIHLYCIYKYNYIYINRNPFFPCSFSFARSSSFSSPPPPSSSSSCHMSHIWSIKWISIKIRQMNIHQGKKWKTNIHPRPSTWNKYPSSNKYPSRSLIRTSCSPPRPLPSPLPPPLCGGLTSPRPQPLPPQDVQWAHYYTGTKESVAQGRTGWNKGRGAK